MQTSTSKRRAFYHKHIAFYRNKNYENLQTACINPPYRLTYQHFSIYSQRMENELNALEGKLALLIQVSGKLRAENHQLRQELAHALSSNRQYSDKMDSAKARLEKLLITLPEDQT
jgi:cell division protein ZapB